MKLYGCPICGTDTVYEHVQDTDDVFRAVVSWDDDGEPLEMYPPEEEVLPTPVCRFVCGRGHSFEEPVEIPEPEPEPESDTP